MLVHLVPIDGGPPLILEREMTLIGRGAECDLCIESKSVSKLHCILVTTDGLVLMRDLGSTNGTWVNGTRVRRAALLPNDRVSVANFHYRILFGAALKDALDAEAARKNADALKKPAEPTVKTAESSGGHAVESAPASPSPGPPPLPTQPPEPEVMFQLVEDTVNPEHPNMLPDVYSSTGSKSSSDRKRRTKKS